MSLRVVKTIFYVTIGLVVVLAAVIGSLWIGEVSDRRVAALRLEQRKADPMYLGDVGGFRIDEFVHPKTGERFLVVSSYRGIAVTQIK